MNMTIAQQTAQLRIDELEFRVTHQEIAIDALTQTNLEQQQQLDRLQRQLLQLHSLFNQLSPEAEGSTGHEVPPHY